MILKANNWKNETFTNSKTLQFLTKNTIKTIRGKCKPLLVLYVTCTQSIKIPEVEHVHITRTKRRESLNGISFCLRSFLKLGPRRRDLLCCTLSLGRNLRQHCPQIIGNFREAWPLRRFWLPTSLHLRISNLHHKNQALLAATCCSRCLL
uniref:Uncharacterized protein LOC105121118 isoform X2 n=1 Tax=Rhizophora mucronata TaxID=61149 RepID=A0A2P2JCM4_RHIMU